MIDLLTCPIEDLRRVRSWDFHESEPIEGGRFTLYELARADHTYVVGADFALGLESGDYDAAIVLDKDTEPVRQVAELHGHWGQNFDRLLYAVAAYFNGAFIVGERQVGLWCLRRLYEMGCWMYYDRREDARSRRVTDKLGYWRSTGDVCIPAFRRATTDRAVIIRSKTTLDQMRRTQYQPRGSYAPDEKAPDATLQVKLAGGGSPDLVMAGAYAWHGINEVEHFPKEKETFKPGTFGHLLDHEQDFYEPEQPKRRRRR